jgi:hypothetical protein
MWGTQVGAALAALHPRPLHEKASSALLIPSEPTGTTIDYQLLATKSVSADPGISARRTPFSAQLGRIR